MDVQLQELIDKIKSDGVASAEKEAAEINQQAKQKADEIVGEAEKKAAEKLQETEREVEQMVRTGKDALTQAGRDLILTLQARITTLFDELIRDEAALAFSGNALEEIIPKLLSSWTSEDSESIDVVLSEADLKSVEAGLKAKLKDRLNEGMEIKSSAGIDGGFRISVKDGSAYYNFTPGEIAGALGEYLNPRLNEMLQQAADR
jgi:V/A-type H+/Na+-transporting ATPase subunit E